ncbi:hypothetical protein BO71DRAFT_398677 [Aspergillus ellipticus CBS 707.79]|uniref:Uncharacterized protein n=1 Tax=Aspergillus ellipticus CBS 707.79 TaxID=1448320 RepID=A0A319DBJ1_9EURO|nr:hypothetical protein BO71DRAFT_398677 [Aspergillus ellipticus CBS 707.79]
MLLHLQALITTHASLLTPIVKTISLLMGFTMVLMSVLAVRQPQHFAENFGIAISSSSPPPPPPPSSDTHQQPQSTPPTQTPTTSPLGWILVFSGREMALGCAILSLLYLNELKAMSVLVSCAGWVGAGDSVATWLYGREGSVWNHLIPSLGFLWVGPVGVVLFSR